MTRLSYAYDLTMFFHFLKEIKEEWKEIPLEQLQTETLSQISVQDIERYLEDLKYRPNDPEHKNMNREQGIKRKFFSLKSFFGYLCRVGLLTVNPTLSMQMPRTHAKEIVRLNSEEMKELLAEVDSGSGLSGRQKAFHERTRLRDSALLALMLGTGIRVSECVGLNLDDVDMKESGIHIRRKGGKETTVYFNAEVARRLNEYLAVRTGIETLLEHKNALFLSLRNQRITVRSDGMGTAPVIPLIYLTLLSAKLLAMAFPDGCTDAELSGYNDERTMAALTDRVMTVLEQLALRDGEEETRSPAS